MSEKNELVKKIKVIFDNNAFLSVYSGFLCSYLFDSIFENYVQNYVDKVDENDIQTIKEIIEVSLDMKLSDFLSVDEVFQMYFLCKEYIKILLNEKD